MARAAQEARRDRGQPRITLRAPERPRQVKAEPESEESPAPAWDLNTVCVYQAIASRARERAAEREEAAGQGGREVQSQLRSSRPGLSEAGADGRGPLVCASPLDGRGSPAGSSSRSRSLEAGTRPPTPQPGEQAAAADLVSDPVPRPRPQERHGAEAQKGVEARPQGRELVTSPSPEGRRVADVPRLEGEATPQSQTQRVDGEGSELDWTGPRECSVSEESLAQRWLGGAPKEAEDPVDREERPAPVEGEGPAAGRPAPGTPPCSGATQGDQSERPTATEPQSRGLARQRAVRTTRLQEEEPQEPPRRRRRGIVLREGPGASGGAPEGIDPEAVSRYLAATEGGRRSAAITATLERLARDDSRRAGGRADEDYGTGLQAIADEPVVASVARGTRQTYGVAWRQ